MSEYKCSGTSDSEYTQLRATQAEVQNLLISFAKVNIYNSKKQISISYQIPKRIPADFNICEFISQTLQQNSINKMAFNKVFIILALAACAMAMPVQPVDDIKSSTEAGSTVGLMAEDTITEQAIVAKETTEAATTEDKSTVSDSVATTTVSEEAGHQDLFKRSADAQDASSDDLETAAGTNVLRPLFVYRQQVAYRQRIKNGNRRGNRRF